MRRAVGDRGHERVVGRLAQPLVEVDDDRRVDAGRREPREPLVGVAQEGRRGAGEHLVGVVVERDHHRPGVAAGRPPRRGARAGRRGPGAARRTRRRRRTRARRERGRSSRPRATCIASGGSAAASGPRARPLSAGARRAPCAGERAGDGAAHAATARPGPREHERRVADRERRLGRGDQALAEAPDLVLRDRRRGAGPRGRRRSGAAPLRCPPGRRRRARGATRTTRRPRAGTRPRRCAPARRGRRRSRAAPEVARERADVRPGGARDVDHGDRAGGVGAVPLEQRRAWITTSRGASSTASPRRAIW